MMTLIAAAFAATAPAVPAAAPADAHAQHQQASPQAQTAQMKEECCCKEMMEKMHSGHDMNRMQDHQEHGGR